MIDAARMSAPKTVSFGPVFSGPAVLFLLALILWSCTFWILKHPLVGFRWDDGYYVVSGEALREGKGYVLPSRPGPLARPKYPIGFPAILVLVRTGWTGWLG
jgi:hypothetical protein